MERWSGMRHDPATYGDLPGTVRAIHDLHARVMISIWPRIGVGTDLGRELAAAGHLFAGRPKDWDKVYDAFSEPARAIYWRHVRDGLLSLGVDAWWMDGTEPEFVDCHDVLQHKRASLAQRDTAAGSWARVLNAYSLATTGGVYERQRAEGADRRVFILTRSAFAGQQRYGTAVWSGDIGASWRTFAAQIPAGLNCCAAGIPYWTTDTGGFFVRGRGGTFPEGVADPAFRELYLRWFQFSCFCPLMRSHGTQTPREIWRFGEPGDPVYEALAAFARLRMRLLPYSYSVAAMATADGYTPMRALGLDFPADSAAHAVADQFGWGPALMACPVTFPMVHMPRERLDAFRPGDLTEPDGSSGALEMAVFDGPLAAEPAHRQRMIVVDCSWSGNRPAGASGDAYRVEVRGHRRVAAGESRAILVRAAGRLRVEIGGRVAADDADAAPLHEHRIETGAWRGQSVALRVAYWHVEGDAVLQVGWEARPAVAAAAPVPRERDVYLPPAPWHDFWTGERLAGPGRVRRPAPLDILPLLVRGGSILPLGPVKQWHDETPDDPLELRVYPGADGAFTLYEDAGDGYGYERGQSSRIPLTWDDARGVLRIGERQGQFPGMLARREFRIVRVRPGHGTGIGVCPAPHRVVAYDGGRQDVVPA
jgi:alpha-D-xyloside xylohydrolase